MDILTQETLKCILFYDKDTGIFTWKIRPSKVMHIGDIAGRTDHHGYRRIKYEYRIYQAHRLAWLYVYGEWPHDQIDHINGIKTDNRISNLRIVTNRENQQNQKRHRAGKLPGTSFVKRDNRWMASIKINGKKTYLGEFHTEQEASKAYLKAVPESGCAS